MPIPHYLALAGLLNGKYASAAAWPRLCAAVADYLGDGTRVYCCRQFA